MVAGEPVEVQVRVEAEDPGLNTRGLVMLAIAAGRDSELYHREHIFKTRACWTHVLQ